MNKLCKCGCGKEVSKSNYFDFIRGHKSKFKLQVCICGCKQKVNVGHKYIKGHNMKGIIPWNKGETKKTNKGLLEGAKKRSIIRIKQLISGEVYIWNKGLTKETDEKVLSQSKKVSNNPFRKDPKYIEKQSKSMKKMWKDPKFIKKQIEGKLILPNKLEISFEKIILPFGFKYVGNRKLIIDGKCPDYINENIHMIIELLGCYWHHCPICFPELVDEDDLGYLYDRMKHFKNNGYYTLFIWEHEIPYNNKVEIKEEVFKKRFLEIIEGIN